jgi:hypothetical protein
MTKLNWLLLLPLALFLAACGGGTPPPPDSITLTVEDPMGNFNAAAYQVGSGSSPWLSLTMTGIPKTGTFSLGNQSKYGVAVRCGLEVKVIQATSSELSNPKLSCSSPSSSFVSFTVDVTFSGIIPDPDNDYVYVNGSAYALASSPTTTVTAALGAGTQDLVITLVDMTTPPGSVKAAKVVRSVNVVNAGSLTVTLSSADVIAPVALGLPTPPSGYTLDTPAVLYRASGGKGYPSVRVPPNSYRPVSGFASGDLYYAELNASSSSGNSFLTSTLFFTGAPSLSLPAPWTPGPGSLSVNQTAHPSLSGLIRSESDLQGYKITLSLFGNLDHTTFLSKGWLGSDTSYSVPDLSSQLGYTTPTAGSGIFTVTALLSNQPLLALDPSSFIPSAGDYLQGATAQTTSYTVGGGPLTLP